MRIKLNYFISRHKGAQDWIKEQSIEIDKFIEHIDEHSLKQGDVVIGSLPINIVARLTEKNIKYIHLELELCYENRGKELTKKDLYDLNAKLVAYKAIEWKYNEK